MAKFKVGDKVRVVKALTDSVKAKVGMRGIITEKGGSPYPYRVKLEKDKYATSFDKKELKLIGKRGRPPKPKPIVFIVKYEEAGKDPYKEFTSEEELLEWFKKAQKDRDIIVDSIEIYPTGKPMKIEASFKLKEKK